jgi:hypothetical protein
MALNNFILASKYAKNKTIELYIDYSNHLYYIFILLTINLLLSMLFLKIYILNQYLIFFIWWFILGVLATIGLGTGMYTGTFYLFPFILNIKNQSQICGNTEFSLLDFECINEEYNNETTNLQILSKAMPPILIWAAGTCVGEIPPYMMAKFAKSSDEIPYINKNIVNYLQSYSFSTITALAVMPNFTFDMCGMASGFLGIPLYKFLSASFIGKGLIKAPIEAYAIMFILDDYINEYTQPDTEKSSWFSFGYNTIFYGTMAYFIKCVVDKMASNYIESNNFNVNDID